MSETKSGIYLQVSIDRLVADVAEIKEAVCGNRPEKLDSSPAAPQPAAPASGWLTRRERTVLELIAMERRTDSDLHWFNDVLPAIRSILSRSGSPPVGWLTDIERRAVAYFADVCRDDLVPDEWTVNAGVLRSMLASAGSPPVVVLPTVFQHSSLGDKLVALQQVKDAMDAAGVVWKEKEV